MAANNNPPDIVEHSGAVTTCGHQHCRQKMLRGCPIVRMGRVVATAYTEITPKGIAVIPSADCIRCGICVRLCSHGATSIEHW